MRSISQSPAFIGGSLFMLVWWVTSPGAYAGVQKGAVPSDALHVYFSTRPEGGGASTHFGCSGEIYAFVTPHKILGAKGDVIKVEWIRPDGVVQEAPEVKLHDSFGPGKTLRFWIRFEPEGGGLMDDFSVQMRAESIPFCAKFGGNWKLKITHNKAEIGVAPFELF